jgi:PAS domain S-box-containing protein
MIAHPGSKTKVRSNISKISEGIVLSHTVKNLTKNNEIIFLDLYERLITDVDGRKKIIITINDATDRVKKDREIVEREYRYRVLFNHSPNGILLLNADGAILEANDSFSAMLGYSRDELSGKYIGKLLTSADKEKVDLSLKRVLNGEQLKHQIEMKKKNGEIRIFELDEVRFPLQENSFGIFMIFNDISARVENLQKLEHAKLLAEKSARLKSDFLAQISHEIRSPLNVILSFVSFLKDEYNLNDPEHSDIFGSISSAGKRITRTIELILNMSELQQGIYEPHFRKVELISEVIEPIIEEYAYYAEYRGLKLELIKETRSATVTADQYSLRQVMANLIDNAIKYTKKGSVKAIVSRKENKVIVSVKDTGIGIKKEFLTDLFDPFSQEETGYKRKYEGAGLGLSLVKNYCDLNKAEVEVESKKNRGAEFRIIFKR